MKRLRRTIRLVAVLSLFSACKPSAAELEKLAREAEAAEKQRAHEAVLKRQADDKVAQTAVPANTPRESASLPVSNNGACQFTAKRAIAKMSSCGLNVAGFTPDSLCAKLGQPKLNYVASRSCQEIKMILFNE